ncbi:hypothetical protein O6H91_02G149800 [Diphasiastrum complanatum]|uniref:Uncharacterized protein n=1 Tax=Diphasiastrum complanatum TaxID=34168 RepID=A0ACC2ELQ7_DIPCM|nr:hypothetical protein O6H91_02G149800 [Diphasiastrum complanatum]
MFADLAHRGSLENLPVDEIICIFRKLSNEDLLVVGMTCRALNTIANTDYLWMERCERWKDEVELADWRLKADSAKALYKVLKTFSEMVGSWSAKELAPRGALLFITWENFSLVACRVLPHSFGDVKFSRLFYVVGMQDGSVKVKLLTVARINGIMSNVHLPGSLVWSSSTKSEFHLEVIRPSEVEAHMLERSRNNGEMPDDGIVSGASTSSARTAIEGQDARERDPLLLPSSENDEMEDANSALEFWQSLILGGIPLDQHEMPLPVGSSELEQHVSNIGRRAFQYLMRLALIVSNRSTMPLGEGDSLAGVGGRSEVLQSTYRILQVDEAKPGQELAGLWSGVYGPHGLEVVVVSYKENEIIATKVLGDPNVPCHQITFKVSIATESTAIPAEIQQLAAMLMVSDNSNPIEIVKLYKGHGRIAAHGFQNPLWVTGQLLVDSKGLMSFFWEDVNFIIQFRRLNLAALYTAQEPSLSFEESQQP